MLGSETKKPLESSPVKSHSHFVVNGDDWDRQLPGLLDQRLPRLKVLRDVHVLERNPFRRKKLFRQLA